VTGGPYETERQAAAEIRRAYDALRSAAGGPPPAGEVTRLNAELLTRACADAGVTLGAYDRRIVQWLAGYEPATCGVIAGLIARANGGAS